MALLLVEGVLRVGSSAREPEPPPTDPSWAPAPQVPYSQVTQYFEGFAVSHYAKDGGRLTGNLWIEGAPEDVLVGDSYVEAGQLPDSSTIGANLERLSRGAGQPLNVRQYGWAGAAPPTYVGLASKVLAQRPRRVVVLLNANDLGKQNFSSRFWKLNDRLETTPNPDRPSGIPMVNLAQRNSLLARTLIWRIKELIATSGTPAGPTPPQMDITSNLVRQLKAAYGDTLLIAYLGADSNKRSEEDAYIFRACSDQNVPCVDLMSRMQSDPHPWRGFSNTALWQGHLNDYGARKTAEAIWEKLQ